MKALYTKFVAGLVRLIARFISNDPRSNAEEQMFRVANAYVARALRRLQEANMNLNTVLERMLISPRLAS